MEHTNVATRPKQELQTEALSWAAKVRGLRVVDATSCVNASQLLKSIKGLQADITNWFAPHIDAAMETKRKAETARKGLADERDRFEAPLVEAEGLIKRALVEWETTQERLRRAEEQRLQEVARSEAEAVTLNAAAALELEAQTTGDAGMLQEAQELLAQPIDTPVISVASFTPKVKGVTYRDNWKAHPDVDIKELARAVAAGEVSPTFLSVNFVALNNFARATMGLQSVPGVKVYNDRTIAVRA